MSKADGLSKTMRNYIEQRNAMFEQELLPAPDLVTCPDCEGDFPRLSSCCGASMDSDIMICSDCKEHSDFGECETCEGKGTISKNTNVLPIDKDTTN